LRASACSPHEAQRNAGTLIQPKDAPDFASLHPGYAGNASMQRGALQVLVDLLEVIEPLDRLVESGA
jgi:hypothetical protein